MRNKFLPIAFILFLFFILGGCKKSNPSGTLKKYLKKEGGEWEVTQIDEYHYGLHFPEYVYSKNLETVGTYFFDDQGNPPIAGDFGAWTAKDSAKKDMIYQVSEIQGSFTATIWYWENGQTTTSEGYEVLEGWDKKQVVWKNTTTIFGDTIIYHYKTLRNTGY